MAGSYEHRNKPYGSVNGGEFLGQLSRHYLHTNSAPKSLWFVTLKSNNAVVYSLQARIVVSQQPAVSRQRPVNNRGIVFSAQSVQMAAHVNSCGGRFKYLHRDEKGTQCLGDINAGTWPSTLVNSRTWDSNIRSWVLWDSGLSMTALARTSSNCLNQTRPLVREGVPHQQTEQKSGLRPQMRPDTKTLRPTDCQP
jgi:hypothetical protein